MNANDCVNDGSANLNSKEESPKGQNGWDSECMRDVLNIDVQSENEWDIGQAFGDEKAVNCEQLIRKIYLNGVKPSVYPVVHKMKLRLNSDAPIFVPPRRLAYHDKEKARGMVNELLEEGIIRPSCSEYASPIVLIKKRSGETRMCIDYRGLNKITLKDNYPLPLMDDCIEFLGNKDCFSLLDLKNGFHQVQMEEESIKFTAFVTPFGQYEYTKMPFGLKNGPAVFQRFINTVFRDMIDRGDIIIYIDDILIATKGVEENLRILQKVLERLNSFGLEIKLKKCHLIKSEIDYLGYIADKRGVRPNDAHVKAISNMTQPTNVKQLQSSVGLFSYFRKFVQGFARIAHPLTELLKKNVPFKFGLECKEAFEKLKLALTQSPVLAVYCPHRETELHTDASSHGFGAVLMQRQDDGKFHPVAYYSKKTSEAESRYHSFELETLAIVYGARRFEPMLKGISFRIVTDCSAVTQTLEKKTINMRIAAWALELQNYNYTVIHRKGAMMGHVDALSRQVNVVNKSIDEFVGVIMDEDVDFNLQAAQARDDKIKTLRDQLVVGEVTHFRLDSGVVYRESLDDNLALYVPGEMERNIIQKIHEKIGHLGVNKCYDQMRRYYWFPSMKEKIQKYIESCLKCIMHSEPPRVTRTLHMIPKAAVPFDTLHLDHYGPLPNIISKKKYLLGASDGFTKFTKLYSVNTTSTKEVCICLTKYFESYGRPRRMVVDRASCFTSQEFLDFVAAHNIELIRTATASPQANGQIERVNRVLTPMLGKLSNAKDRSDWSKVLGQVEYALNNSVSRATKFEPSKLLFGVLQRGPIVDELSEYLETKNKREERDLTKIREEADKNIKSEQAKNVEYHNKRVRPAKSFEEGDYVVIRNVDNTIGKNKKLIPKYKGPYVVHKILPNDRYIVKDIENCQITQTPYTGILEAARMKHWIRV